jgi:hypothetical protein
MADDVINVPLPRSFSMTRTLASYVTSEGCEFVVHGHPQPAAVILGEDAFLPIVALFADIELRSLLGECPGIEFKTTEESLFGTSVHVDDLTPDLLSIFRGLVFIDATRRIFNVRPGTKIECAPLFETYKAGLVASLPKSAAQAAPLNR